MKTTKNNVAVAATNNVAAKKATKKATKKAAKKTGNVSAAVAKARATRHAVLADGKEYQSVFKAFAALKLPIGRHAIFRKRLKAAGKLAFESGKRTIQFKIVKG